MVVGRVSLAVGSTRYPIATLVDVATRVQSRLSGNVLHRELDDALTTLIASADVLATVELGTRLLHTLASDGGVWIGLASPTLRSVVAMEDEPAPEIIGIVDSDGPVYVVNARNGVALNGDAIHLAFSSIIGDSGDDFASIPDSDFDDALASTTPAQARPPSGERAAPGSSRVDEFAFPRGDAEIRDGDGGDGDGGNGAGGAGGGGGEGGGAAPTVVTSRYLRTELPARAPVGTEVSLLVRVTMQPGDGPGSTGIDLVDIPPEGASLHVVVNAPGLQAVDGLEHDLLVPPDGDSQPVRFGFLTKAVALHKLHVTAWRGGSFVGEIELEISVEAAARIEEGSPQYVPISVTANPGEVTLQVRFDAVARQYMFQLLSSDRIFDPIIESLGGSPDAEVNALAQHLSEFAAKRAAMAGSAAQNWMREAGVGLWLAAVPKAIRDEFWELHANISAFTIATDADVVPWELLYPLDETNDADFLVKQFPVTRRVYGQPRVHSLALGGVKYVVPPGAPSDAMQEVAAVRRRFGSQSDPSDVISTLAALQQTLEHPDFGVLHFACHNNFNAAAGSSVSMDGGPFVPLLLNTAVAQHRFESRSPLVFFNACRTAGEVFDYTQLSGWTSQFMRAGVGAFVGTLWSVRSSSAVAFADSFYQAFVDDHQPLGKAAMSARAAIRTPDDPTWLAYTVYGDPTATALEGVA